MIVSHFLKPKNLSTKPLHRSIKFFNRKKEKTDTLPPEQSKLETRNKNKVDASQAVSKFQNRNLPHLSAMIPVRQAWVENLDTLDSDNLGLIDLHPDVFGTRPRLDLIYENFHWQRIYKYINFNHVPWKHEIQKSLRKPWPQLKSGRAHHGTRREPEFLGGVKTYGPHGPETHFFMLEKNKRVVGLTSMLSVKLAQDDLHIVSNLEIPTKDPQFIQDLVDNRKWGPSVLFVDVEDTMPQNISLATFEIKHMNLMPVYGLNVYSMLKHVTLVLTLKAVERIEERLLHHLYGPQYHSTKENSFSLNWKEEHYA